MTQLLRPISTISAGAWTASTTTLHGDTDEGIDNADDETTYAEVSTFANDMELLLATGVDPLTGTGHVMRWRARRHQIWVADAELTVSLYQGAVLIATSSGLHGSSYTTGSYTLSAAEANAISDYSDLRMRVRIAVDIGTAHVHLTAMELAIPSLETHASPRGRLVAPVVLGEVVQPLTRGEVKDTR